QSGRQHRRRHVRLSVTAGTVTRSRLDRSAQGFAAMCRTVRSGTNLSLPPSATGEDFAQMLVVVTGGTGYVGSHAVAALVGAGHRVRVMARSPDRVQGAFAPLGVDDVETAVGDVTDAAAVERALEGGDALLHAASVFSFDARKAEEMREVNVRATETVLGAAHRLGLDPIV